MKKYVSWLVVLALLMTLLSVMAVAESSDATTAVTPETTVTTVTQTTDEVEPPTGLFEDSLLPSSASDFGCVAANGGNVTVSAYEDGYRFKSSAGWPWAWYSVDAVEDMICVDPASASLQYDIEVVSGATKVMVFFAGQGPNDAAVRGSYVTINGLEYPSSVDPSTGDSVYDLPVGTYTGYVPVTELGYHEGLLNACGVMYFSGIKVFAVAGEVIVRNLSIVYTPGVEATTTTAHTVVTKPGTVTVTAQSLMPATMSQFARAEGDGGTMMITPYGDGYRFVSDQGWPSAWYEPWFDTGMIFATDMENTYLRYDFEVVSGAAKINVYFCGQSPESQASKGSFVCINGLIHPDWVDPSTGDTSQDLPVGTYAAMVPISQLGYSEMLLGDQGKMAFSGMKIFAVDGETIIHDLSIVTVEPTTDGDIDGTGSTNVRDALMLYQYVSARNTALTAEQLVIADIDKNGIVNMRDALALFRAVSGK